MSVEQAKFWRSFGFVLAILTGFLTISAFFAPRFIGVGPIICGIISLAIIPLLTTQKIFWPKRLILWTATFLILAGLSAVWAIDSAFAFERTIKMTTILLGGLALITAFLTLPANARHNFRTILPGALIILGMLIILEHVLGFPFYKFSHEDANNISDFGFVLNRQSVCFFLLLFPAAGLLILHRNQEKTARLFSSASILQNKSAIILTILLAINLLLTESQSVQLAFIISILFVLFFPYSRKWAWSVLSIAITAFIMSFPWVSQYLFAHLTNIAADSSWLRSGAAPQRLEIWNFISKHILDNFWYGDGIEATRAITFETDMVYHKSATVLHPHSFALQLWMEFGVIGAVLASLFCVYIINTIKSALSIEQARIVLPAFMAWLSIASTGYGLWQSWWLGLTLFVTALMIIAIKTPKSMKSCYET